MQHSGHDTIRLRLPNRRQGMIVFADIFMMGALSIDSQAACVVT
jgi:hypothetical protein